MNRFSPQAIADGILSGEIECQDGEISRFSGKFLNSCNLSMIDRGVWQIGFCAKEAINNFTPEGQSRIRDAIRRVNGFAK